MMRILQHSLEVIQKEPPYGDYRIEVWEQVRRAKPRLVADFLVGNSVSSEDLYLALQVLEDACSSGVRRTLGVQDPLPF